MAPSVSASSNYNVEVNDIQSAELEDRLCEVQKKLSAARWRRNTSMRINCLPPEILIHILCLSTSNVLSLDAMWKSDDVLTLDNALDLQPLRLVCKHWTSVINNTPSLWINISSYNVPVFTALSLKNSQPYPIHVAIARPDPDSTLSYTQSRWKSRRFVEETIKLILPHAHRFQSLSVHVEDHDIDWLGIDEVLSQSMPQLQRCSLSSSEDDDVHDSSVMLKHSMPVLKILYLSGFRMPFCEDVPELPELENLCCSWIRPFTPKNLRHLFLSCQNLVELELDASEAMARVEESDGSVGQRWPNILQGVQMPKLQSLTFKGSSEVIISLLSAINTAPKQLKVECTQGDLSGYSRVASIFSNWLARGGFESNTAQIQLDSKEITRITIGRYRLTLSTVTGRLPPVVPVREATFDALRSAHSTLKSIQTLKVNVRTTSLELLLKVSETFPCIKLLQFRMHRSLRHPSVSNEELHSKFRAIFENGGQLLFEEMEAFVAPPWWRESRRDTIIPASWLLSLARLKASSRTPLQRILAHASGASQAILEELRLVVPSVEIHDVPS